MKAPDFVFLDCIEAAAGWVRAPDGSDLYVDLLLWTRDSADSESLPLPRVRMSVEGAIAVIQQLRNAIAAPEAVLEVRTRRPAH